MQSQVRSQADKNFSGSKKLVKSANYLERDLRKAIRGEVRFDDGSRALYSTDSSNYRQPPIGVVLPRDNEDVEKTVALCRKYGVPITSRGGGTSLAGQCCNVSVIIDFSKYMHHLIELDPARKLARVQPGMIYDDLNRAAAKHKLAFGPDPSTHSHCTIGGMVGNNSCGLHSMMASFAGTGARTSDNLHELEILTYDGLRMRVGQTPDLELSQIIRGGGRHGEIYEQMRALRDRHADLIRERYPKISRRVSGYNLDDLLPEKGFHVARALTGSEGTCVTVLEATVHLIYSPPIRSLVALGYSDVYTAADQVPEILQFKPVALEGIDDLLIDGMKKKKMHPGDFELLPPGAGWLLVEFGGETKEEADAHADAMIHSIKGKPHPPSIRLYDAPFTEHHIWLIRESGLPATARIPNEPDAWEGWEDSAVPPERLGDYLRDFRKLLQKFGYGCSLYGHFGQGVTHVRINFGLKDHAGVQAYERFGYEAAELVVRYGGSLSGEHGDGQSRGELLSIMFGDDLVNAFHEYKRIWDPEWKMNPGKIVSPYRRDENLRLGENYSPAKWRTHFTYPEDNGSFAYAMERCVGVGKCRQIDGGTMCPSYLVTREEKHSTRGRARLLFELMQGKLIGKSAWRDKSTLEALDLCLGCKGCKGDCPMQVDMATYKAEFLSHYYQGRLRPMSAYTMGLIYGWARLASIAPNFVNFFTQTQPFANLLKSLGGISTKRQLPAFASESFKKWFFSRPKKKPGTRRVILWPDTFSNFLLPGAARAAVEVLEAAGFEVVVPSRPLCCGRPLYDYGMLELAKHLLRQILETLQTDIRAGIPIVGLEPSCTAVFRDELRNLFPNDQDAVRLASQTYTLSEFLEQHAHDFVLPKLYRKAIVHAHCHHRAIMKINAEEAVLKRLGLDYEILDSGCCGMAGSFGFESDKYDVSVACGERVLLPAVRRANKDTLVIADGFSCREQIQQHTDRRALHLAEVIRLAMEKGSRGPEGNYPERDYAEEVKKISSLEVVGFTALAMLAVGVVIPALFRNGRHWR